MAIAYDTHSSQSQGLSTSNSMSMTVASNSNRLLIALVAKDDTDTISSVTWNGTSMTLAHSHEAYSPRGVFAYYLVAPDTGTYNLVANFSGSTTSVITGVSLYGVDQSSPIGATAQGNVDNTTGNSYNITTTTSDSWIIAAACYEGGIGNLTIRSGYTTLGVLKLGGVELGGMYRSTTSAGNYEAGFTHTSAVSQENVSLAFEVKEHTGAVAVVSNMTLLGVG